MLLENLFLSSAIFVPLLNHQRELCPFVFVCLSWVSETQDVFIVALCDYVRSKDA